MDLGHSASVPAIEDSPRRRESEGETHLGASSEQDESGTESVPKSPTYPLNSKHLKAGHLQRMADSLGLPTKGTAAVMRRLIIGRLTEMGQA